MSVIVNLTIEETIFFSQLDKAKHNGVVGHDNMLMTLSFYIFMPYICLFPTLSLKHFKWV